MPRIQAAAQATPTTDATPAPAAPADNKEIVITGTISRNPAAATASPVVSVTADDIQKRGITTVTEYLQTLSANNAGTVPPSWSSFGFTTGASAPSLRGFNDAYTLVLFDSMRIAVYPLADDTQRNIIDINTDSGVDRRPYRHAARRRVGDLRFRRHRGRGQRHHQEAKLQGLHANGSFGISQKGDGERISRFSLDLRRRQPRDDG